MRPASRRVASSASALMCLAVLICSGALAHAGDAAGVRSMSRFPPAELPGEWRYELPPIALISEFTGDSLKAIIAAGGRHRVFSRIPVYMGQYGINSEHSLLVHEVLRGRYAPIFVGINRIDPTTPRRVLGPEDQALLPPNDIAFAGPLPVDRSRQDPVDQVAYGLTDLSVELQFRWGIEIGRRLRDQIRLNRRRGVLIDSWQLDEIVSQVYALTPSGAALRWYFAGEVLGLARGRRELGDRLMRGIVFIARPERFAALPNLPDVERLYVELDGASLRVFGEEFPAFEGSAKAVAAAARASAQQRLAGRAGAAARLSRRYGVILTPGYEIVNGAGKPTGLNGNIHHYSDARVDAWRNAYIEERIKGGVAGIGEYNFVGNNARTSVVRAAVAAVAVGLSKLLLAWRP